MKKSEILTMSSEGVFDYFYPTLCNLTNENEELKNKVKSLSEDNQILTEANDNLRDMLEGHNIDSKIDMILKQLGDNKMTGIKQIYVDKYDVQSVAYRINTFLETFDLNLVDTKTFTCNTAYDSEIKGFEDKIIVLITWKKENCTKEVFKFICNAKYDKDSRCWYSKGMKLEEAKELFGDCYEYKNNIYFK